MKTLRLLYCAWLAATLTLLSTGCRSDDEEGNPEPGSGARLYVVQTGDESLAQIDLADGRVNAHMLDLGLYCNDLVRHGGRLYVANSGTNEIQEIDAERSETIRVIPLGDGASPWTVAFLNNDTMAVSCLGTRSVVLVRLSSGSVIAELPTATVPEGLIVHEGYLYVCETGWVYPTYANGQVRIYSARTWELEDSVGVGVNAQFGAVDEYGRLHVVCTGNYADIEGQIHIVNLSARTVDAIIPIGGTPNTVSIGGSVAIVAAGGWSGSPGFVYRYRLSDLTILNGFVNPITTGSGATDVEALEDGSFYVSCQETDEVRFHGPNGVLIQTYELSDGPGYMLLFGDDI